MRIVNLAIASSLLVCSGLARADNLDGVDQLVCSSGQAQICLENGSCYAATPWELSVPDFVLIDVKKHTVRTTRASGLNRSTTFSSFDRADGLIKMQGVESGRAFSFVIHEATGKLTASIARDGLTVTVFGACTSVDL